MRYDRDALLARVDLYAIADELLGHHAGSDRSPKWTCPVATHAQTGRTPPLSVFVSRHGEQRFRCHGCGASGTAIDLVMHAHGMGVRDAIEWLANRTSLMPEPVEPRRRAPIPTATTAHPGIEPYVAECEWMLWTRACAGPLQWLTEERGLSEEILRANRVGFDPGPVHLERPDGIPCATGIVLPVLDADGQAIYTQTRRLGEDIHGPRYINCASRTAPNPRVAFYRSVGEGSDALVVCEGALDALTAADVGCRAAGLLGSTVVDDRSAALVAEAADHVVIAFDADDAGDRGAAELDRLLAGFGRGVVHLRPPERYSDLNAWLQGAGDECWEALSNVVVEHQSPCAETRQLGRAICRG